MPVSTLAKNVVKNFSDKSDAKISTATTNVVAEVRDNIVKEVIRTETNGVDISGLASKTELAAKADSSLVSSLSTAIDLKANLTSLDDYVTHSQLNGKNFATKSYASSTAMTTSMDLISAALGSNFAKIWKDFDEDDNSKGYFLTKKTNADGSYAQLWNEPDGGGSQYFNKTADIISYVGTNDGDENGICVQIYAKSYSGANQQEVDGVTEGLAKNEGVRINVNPYGAYYTKGSNISANGGVSGNGREIAVKEDVTSLRTQLNNKMSEVVSLRNRVTQLETKVSLLEDALKKAVDSNGNLVYEDNGEEKPIDDEL